MSTEFEKLYGMAEAAGREPRRQRQRLTPRRAALSGERDDDDLGDQDNDDPGDEDTLGVGDALHVLGADEASAIGSEVVRIIADELRNGGVADGPVVTSEKLREMRDALAAKIRSMPTLDIIAAVCDWMRTAIRSRTSQGHAKDIMGTADLFARKAGYHGETDPAAIGLSNGRTAPFRLYFRPRNVRRLTPCN